MTGRLDFRLNQIFAIVGPTIAKCLAAVLRRVGNILDIVGHKQVPFLCTEALNVVCSLPMVATSGNKSKSIRQPEKTK